MKGPERSRYSFEGLTTAQIRDLKELRDSIGGEEGALAVKQMLLGIQLTNALNALEIPDAEDLVANNLMAPQDSDARIRLIEHLSREAGTREAIRLLKELETLISD